MPYAVSLQRHSHLSAQCKDSFVVSSLSPMQRQFRCLISQPHAKTVSLSHLSAPCKDSFVVSSLSPMQRQFRCLISQPHAKTVSLKRHPRPPTGLSAGLNGLQCKTLRVRMRTLCLAFSRKLFFFFFFNSGKRHKSDTPF